MSDITTKPSLKNLDIFFVTFGGSGYAPKAPGTAGSLAILIPLMILGQFNPPFFLYFPILIPLTCGSWYVIKSVEEKYKIHDPGWIVIDEVIGMWITILFLPKQSIIGFIIAFIYFRAFDIIKPWPVSFFDEQQTPLGTLLDDVVAGILAGLSCILTFKLIDFLA